MRTPEDLTRDELLHVVEVARRALYREGEVWHRDKEWDRSDVELIAGVLDTYGLIPEPNADEADP